MVLVATWRLSDGLLANSAGPILLQHLSFLTSVDNSLSEWPEMVRFLLNRGANLEGNVELRTLTAAAKRGSGSVVEMLCNQGVVIAGTEA